MDVLVVVVCFASVGTIEVFVEKNKGLNNNVVNVEVIDKDLSDAILLQ